jgi:hypothetical protein
MCIYLIGSLRNQAIPEIAQKIRALGLEVFDDWHAAGPEADDAWQHYETSRGHDYKQALKGWAARHVFGFDYHHLSRASAAVLVLPAGKSAHLEAGWMIGKGKPVYFLFDKAPERFDQMYAFALTTGGDIFFNEKDLLDELARVNRKPSSNTRPSVPEPLQHRSALECISGRAVEPGAGGGNDDAAKSCPDQGWVQ